MSDAAAQGMEAIELFETTRKSAVCSDIVVGATNLSFPPGKKGFHNPINGIFCQENAPHFGFACRDKQETSLRDQA